VTGYDFLQAFHLFDLGSEVLAQVESSCAKLADCDWLMQNLMVRFVDIDRGIHNNDFAYTVDTCNRLLQTLEAYPACKARLMVESQYLVLMREIAQLMVNRDAGNDSVEDWAQVRSQLQSLYQEYKAKGLTIHSSILQAFLMALPSWQQAGDNRLQVTRGRAIATFYATLTVCKLKG